MNVVFTFLTGGVVGGFIGTFLGGFTKFFWEHWLPDWLTWRRKQRVQQRELLAKQRDPAVRAISELESRLWTVLKNDAANYQYVKSQDRGEYYIESTAFVIAQYFAWSELMRRQMAALDYSDLSNLLARVSDGFAHGGPGLQLYFYDQREIGERLMMASTYDPDAPVFRYSDFRDMMAESTVPESLRALRRGSKFLLEHVAQQSSRAVTIQHALIDLLDFVDPDNRWISARRRDKYPTNDKRASSLSSGR